MRASASAGFTLLEILVALAVFGFLLVGLNQTVRFGVTAWRQAGRVSEGKTDLEAVDRSLRAIIQNLSPTGDPTRPALAGTTDTLTGVTALRLPEAGLSPVPVEAGLAVSGTRLVLRWRPYHHVDPLRPPPPPQEAELIGGVSRLRIAYWQASGGWSSNWTDPGLPLLIRIRLIVEGDGAERWPDIIAAPLLSRP
jgi:general secretion pathway protein J